MNNKRANMRISLGWILMAIFIFVLLAFLPVALIFGTLMYGSSPGNQSILIAALPLGILLAWLISLAVLLWQFNS